MCRPSILSEQMPSTLVHLALAGLIAGALLRREFDSRSLALVLVVTATPDLDSLVGLVIEGRIGRRSTRC